MGCALAWWLLAAAFVVSVVEDASATPLTTAVRSLVPPKPDLPTRFVGAVNFTVEHLGAPAATTTQAVAAAGTPHFAPPRPLPHWTRGGGGPLLDQELSMWYDETREAMRYDEVINVTFLPNCHGLQVSSFAFANWSRVVINDQCRDMMQPPFQSLWSWVADAAYAGQRAVNGRLCDVWELSYEDQFNGTLFVDGDDPVKLVDQVLSAFLPGQPPERTQYTWEWQWLNRTAPNATVFRLPSACDQLPPPPCDDGAVQDMTFYIAHPPSDYNLTNQDAADLLGDVLFTCDDVLHNNTKADNYSVVSQYTVRVDSHWGQYQLCNGYHPPYCVGNETFHVGREATYGCGADKAGQCNAPSEDGFWFSFPAGGECTGGKDIHKGECSWQVIERVKTVAIDCLFNVHRMGEFCFQSTDDAVRVFLRAFASSDVGKGGCPDIPPPSG